MTAERLKSYNAYSVQMPGGQKSKGWGLYSNADTHLVSPENIHQNKKPY